MVFFFVVVCLFVLFSFLVICIHIYFKGKISNGHSCDPGKLLIC